MKKLFTASLMAATVSMAATAELKSVVDREGMPVVDRQGDCVVAVGAVKDCKDAPVQTAPPKETLTLNADALFDTAKHTLTAQGKAAVQQVAAAAQGAVAVEVVGHADSRGGTTYNQRLSERRAATVANALASMGIPVNIISMRGVGETQPVASNATAEGRQQNRRVDVTLVKEQVKK